MMFVTNGTVQDLPSDQQFAFWDNQLDWGRAYILAKVEQANILGADRAPHYQMIVHILLDVIKEDRWRVFTSRPVGQEPNWCQWAKFCGWFFRHNQDSQEVILNEIRRGEIYSWYTNFSASAPGIMIASHKCCGSSEKVSSIVFWDFHEFDRGYCKSKRKVPETWPTPEEMAKIAALAKWYGDTFGTAQAKNFFESPPTPQQNAATFSPQPPPPVEDVDLGSNTVPSKGSSKSFLPFVVVGALAIFGWVVLKPNKPNG